MIRTGKTPLIILLVGILILMAAGCSQESEKTEEEIDKKIEELMAKASEVLEEGDYDTVIDIYEEALELRDDEEIRKELERIKQIRP